MRTIWISLAALVVFTAAESTFGQKGDTTSLKKQRDAIAEQLSAKNKELREIRDSIAKSDKVAPVQKELLTAFQAIRSKQDADPEVQKARKARDEAKQAREAVLTAELKANKDAAQLYKQIDEANARIKQAQESIRAAERTLGELRGKVAKDSAKVVAAQATADKVYKAYEEIKNSKSTDERARHDKIRATFDSKTSELLAGDTRATGLRKSIDELQKKDRELASQIRAIDQPAKAKAESKPAPEQKDKAKDKDKKNKAEAKAKDKSKDSSDSKPKK